MKSNVRSDGYLMVYNLLCCLGWAVVWKASVQHVIAVRDGVADWPDLWQRIPTILTVVQTAAVLEILHSALGIVRSPVFSTFMQVSSRLFVLWACFILCEDSTKHWAFTLTVLSWATVEVPRYLFYAWNLAGTVPRWLLFLRYHLFAVLYPSGITGEIMSMLITRDWLASTKQYPELYYLMTIILASYVPFSPYMYWHMIKQRNGAYAKLRKGTKAKTK